MKHLAEYCPQCIRGAVVPTGITFLFGMWEFAALPENALMADDNPVAIMGSNEFF